MKDPSGRDSPDHRTTRLTESETSPEDDLISTLAHWDLYRIERLLGTGGMARVYLGFDKKLNRYVALKFLRSDDEKLKLRLLREARAQAQIEHDHVCKIYEASEIGGRHYIAMQYINGKNLDAIAERVSLKQRVNTMQQISSAVQAAHQLGIIHRDIKPTNIMIEERKDGSLRPYILDFGIARDLAAPGITVTERIMGTPAYMSPEQASGAVVDYRSDIYSLGATLYELLTGTPPFEGANSLEILTKVLQQDPTPPKQKNRNIPQDLETIILKSMDKQPERRYRSAELLAQDLGRYLKGESILAKRSSWTGRVAKKVKRDPRISALFAAATVTVVVLVAASVWIRVRGVRSENVLQPKLAQSIAVLPFASPDANTEYLGDGITEGVINHLSQIPDLKVMARSTVSAYKGKKIDPLKVGLELKVDNVVTGSLLQRNNALVVTANLISSQDGSQLWGNQYNLNASDLLLVPSYLSREISQELRFKLTEKDQQKLSKLYTHDPSAYDSYLQGRYTWNLRTVDGMQRAIENYQQAIKKDPNFALAYAGLAHAYLLYPDFSEASPMEVRSKVEDAAKKALQLDESIAEAHTALAMIRSEWDFNWPAAESQFRRAIELNPNSPTARYFYAIAYLTPMKRLEEAAREMEKALEFDPNSPVMNTNYATILMYQGKLDAAEQILKRTLFRSPDFPITHRRLGDLYLLRKQYDRAITEYRTSTTITSPYVLTCALTAAGRREEAKQILTELKKRKGQTSNFYATVYSCLGDRDQAFRWLEKMYQERDFDWDMTRYDICFRSVRSDPRYAAYLQKLHLPK